MTLIFSHSREIFNPSWRHVTKTLRSSRNSQTWSFYIVGHQKGPAFEENRCQVHLLPSGVLNLDFLFWICRDYSCPSFRAISCNIEPALSDFRPPPDRGHTTVRVFWVGEIIEWMGTDPWETRGTSTTLNKFSSTKREATTKPRLALWGICLLMREAFLRTWKWLMLRNGEAKNIPTAKIMCVWMTPWFSPFHCHFQPVLPYDLKSIRGKEILDMFT